MLPKITNNVVIFMIVMIAIPELSASKKLTENYISRYKNMAIAEMYRTGIPASIKLAQGILESDLGRSPLASMANNHFGIKCGKEWAGNTYFKHDDDTDSTGTIIESCFRAYDHSEQSFTDHSDFLTNPAKKSRYGFLFELGTTDYVGWANGLKFAGYASDPSYPTKLIKIIENYRLYELDVPVNSKKDELASSNHDFSKSNSDIKSETKTDAVPAKEKYIKIKDTDSNNTPDRVVIGKYQVKKINDIKMVHAFGGESVKELALRNKKDVHDILEYNENIRSQDHILHQDEIVYFEKKKKSVDDISLAFHTVSKGETIYTIAQKYGIRLESIMSKNNLPTDAEPLTGELVSLSRNMSKKESPKYRVVEKFDSFIDFGGLQ